VIAFAATLVALIGSFAMVRAQQSQPADPPRPMLPVAASSVATHPELYLGETVSMMGTVDQSFSRTIFSIDQDKTTSTGHDVLVLAPTLNGAVVPNSYVTVVGQVMRFDPVEIAGKMKEFTLDLTPEVVAKYRGRPAVLATAIINSALVDLAKRLPTPMTPEEDAYDKVMKRVGPAFTALRQAVAATTAETAKEPTGVLKQAFADVEAFWKARAKMDAIGWTQDARKQVESIERAAGSGDWETVKAASTSLGLACQNCHAAYRERFDDGTYRIKTGAVK
jgi:hypothetical protein